MPKAGQNSLQSSWVVNPLPGTSSNGEVNYARVFAKPVDLPSSHPDVEFRTAYDVCIEFGVVRGKGQPMEVDEVQRSAFMTADVMGVSPGLTRNLHLEDAQAMIEKFEMGEAFKPSFFN